MLAAVLTLTACGLMTGPLGQEAQRLPLDRLPAAEPSEWSSAAPPLAARPTATASSPTERGAASPRPTAAASAGGARKAQPVAPQPAPTLRAVERPAAESPAAPSPSPDSAGTEAAGRRPARLETGVPGGFQQRQRASRRVSRSGLLGKMERRIQGRNTGYRRPKRGEIPLLPVQGAECQERHAGLVSPHGERHLHGRGAHSQDSEQQPSRRWPAPRHNSLLYGRISVRFKADPLHGFKTAWLLWPDSGVWPRDGELDYPEGDLSQAFYGAVHAGGMIPRHTDVFRSQVTFVERGT